MARKNKTYADLMKLAKTYGVDKNALFIQAAEQYSVQQMVIQQIRDALQNDDDLLTSKEYVKDARTFTHTHLLKSYQSTQTAQTRRLERC